MYKVYSQAELKQMGRAKVLHKLEMVKVSDASVLVREKNLEAIEIFLNGGVKQVRDKSIAEDMKASEPDYSDFGDM